MFIESKDKKILLNSRFIKRILIKDDGIYAVMDRRPDGLVVKESLTEITTEELNRLKRFES